MIYFCIPAHNEERTVGVVLWKLRQVMAELGRDYQIIVVDDASTDSTPAVLSPYIRVLPLTVFRNAQRRGYADSAEIAIREALRRSPYPKRDSVITLQADFTEDPDIVPTFVKRIEAGADLVATEVEIESAAPRPVRWGRRLFRWLLRKREWAIGDPLSGLRAYRVVTLKRALEARGTGRLLTHNGWAANAELLSQAVPHSRRSDVVETTLKHHRLQRTSRFSFMNDLREIRSVMSGKPGANTHALPVDNVIVAALPIAVEPAKPRYGERDSRGRTGSRRPERSQSQSRGERPARPAAKSDRPARPAARSARPARPENREKLPPPTPLAAASTAVVVPEEAGKLPAKKRRRPRRRKSKQQQQPTQPPTLTVEPTEAPAASDNGTAPSAEAPKKKSRRGRRGGRGRRRGPSKTETNGDSQNTGGNDAPPPMAAEGD